MGLIFPLAFYLVFILIFSLWDPPKQANLIKSYAILGVYVISLIVGHFIILKNYREDFKRFLLTLYYSFLTVLIGIFISWFISEVI
jgi:hypothetical protein